MQEGMAWHAKFFWWSASHVTTTTGFAYEIMHRIVSHQLLKIAARTARAMLYYLRVDHASGW
jgi:hypothetical protein